MKRRVRLSFFLSVVLLVAVLGSVLALSIVLFFGFESPFGWVRWGVALIVAGIIAFLTASFYYLLRLYGNFFAKLESSFKSLAAGGATEYLPDSPVHEIHKLSGLFNRTARSLQELREAEIAKKNLEITAAMASQVAHDIRSPLASLIAVTTHAEGMDEYSRVLLRNSVTRIRDIANNLLSRYRGDGKKGGKGQGGDAVGAGQPGVLPGLSDEPRSVELLFSLADSILSEKRALLDSQPNIQIKDDYFETGFGLFANIQPAEFGRVISNLINNAIESFERGGLIEVSLDRDGDHAVIKVKDDGKGIPPDILPLLGQKAMSFGKPNGNGLGIYHARITLESWGGSLKLESVVNLGTTVTIRLPLAATPKWFASGIEITPPCHIVVLDDDPGIHEVWKKRLALLERPDIQLSHFHSTQEVLVWYRESLGGGSESPFYLFDYELIGSRQTGLEVIEMLGIAAQSVLVTSRAQEHEIRERCEKFGIRVLPKALASFVPILVRG